MDNDFYLSKGVKWVVLLPDGKKLNFDNPLLELRYEERFTIRFSNNSPEEYHDESESNEPHIIIPEELKDLESDDNSSNMLLFDVLQDFYYVTHFDLHKNDNNISKRLESCDNFWTALRVYWRCLLELVKEKQNFIYNDYNSEKRDILFIKKGRSYRKFINSMGEPYATRYFAYRLLKPLYSLRPKSMTLGYCTDIICNFIDFQKFWNNGIKLFSHILLKIQKENSVKRLKSDLEKITKSKEYNDFKDLYLYGKSCFMQAKIIFKDRKVKVLCFSGLYFKQPIINAIKIIKQSDQFKDAYFVDVSDDIRYYLPNNNSYITYGEAKQIAVKSKKKINYESRMFSCCERKTFADFNWNGCQSYEMIVKYAPCELCHHQVNIFKNLYNGKTISGKSTGQLKKRQEYDAIAMNIYNKLHTKRFNMKSAYIKRIISKTLIKKGVYNP